MKKAAAYFFLVFCIVLLHSCANIVPLQGGPEDQSPPLLVKAEPDTFSANFTGKKITLWFDEYIVVKNAQKEVIVVPPIDLPPEIRVKGKSIEVMFQDSLKRNTTYTVNFGAAIADNNEGRIMQGFSYVFSTGTYLDSLVSKALVLDAFTLKPLAGAKYMLYETTDDSLPYTTKPFYVGYAAEGGNAVIRYMRGGNYKPFVLIENNNNYLYDAPDEQIGFLDTVITPDDSVVTRFMMFRERTEKTKLRTAKMLRKGKIYFKFISDASSVEITPLTDSLPPFRTSFEFANEAKDSLVYWYPLIGKDTLFFQLRYAQNDSLGNPLLDTVRVVAKPNSGIAEQQSAGSRSGGFGNRTTVVSKNNDTLKTARTDIVQITHSLSEATDYFKFIDLAFSQPVKSLDSSAFRLLEDGKEIRVENIVFLDSIRRNVRITNALAQGKMYTLLVSDSSIFTLWNETNDSLRVNFKTTRQKDYMSISLNVKNVKGTGRLIFYLLSKDDKVLEEKVSEIPGDSTMIVFERLKAETYRVKLVYDTNRNGKWDTGSYLLGVQPEKVSYFPQPVALRPSFSAAFDWDVENPEPPKVEGRRR